MVTNKGASANLECKSTDVKPTTGVDVNTKIHELDTDKYYYFTGETWAEIPSSGGGFTPTEEQLTAMNSGITATDVQQIDTNKTNISLSNNGVQVEFTTGAYINANINIGDTVSLIPQEAGAWEYAIYAAVEAQPIRIIGSILGGNSSRAWAFIDEDNKLLSKADASAFISNTVLYPPQGTAKVILNSQIDATNATVTIDGYNALYAAIRAIQAQLANT